MDFLGGLDFKKGCYVGQEVVSRMQHRGTARRRPVIVTGVPEGAAAGAPLSWAKLGLAKAMPANAPDSSRQALKVTIFPSNARLFGRLGRRARCVDKTSFDPPIYQVK